MAWLRMQSAAASEETRRKRRSPQRRYAIASSAGGAACAKKSGYAAHEEPASAEENYLGVRCSVAIYDIGCTGVWPFADCICHQPLAKRRWPRDAVSAEKRRQYEALVTSRRETAG